VAEYALYRGDPGGDLLLYPCVGSVNGPGRCLFLKVRKNYTKIYLKLERCGAGGSCTLPLGLVCGGCRAGGALLLGGGYC
jgi:hypothetical protein